MASVMASVTRRALITGVLAIASQAPPAPAVAAATCDVDSAAAQDGCAALPTSSAAPFFERSIQSSAVGRSTVGRSTVGRSSIGSIDGSAVARTPFENIADQATLLE